MSLPAALPQRTFAELAPRRRVPPPAGSTWVATRADGLRVVLAEDHTVPLVRSTWISRGGAGKDPSVLPGLATLTASALRAGTASRDADRIAEELDDLGADLVVGCDWDDAFLTVELLSADLQAGLELLLELATRPGFPEREVEELRARRSAELRRRRLQAPVLANEALARALYPASPCGRSLLGDDIALEATRRRDLAEFHSAYYRPEDSCLLVVGSCDPVALAALVGPLGSDEIPRHGPPPTAPVDPPSARIRVVDFPSLGQVELRLGWVTLPRTHADFPALHLLDAILGDPAAGRLGNRLRERLGLTYHVRSRLDSREGPGPLLVRTRVVIEHLATAVGAILHEIESIQTVGVAPAELDAARRALQTSFLRRAQSLHERATALRRAAFDDDPGGFFERCRRGIEAVEVAQMRTLARRHLPPESTVVVAVGPANQICEQLRPFSDATGVPIERQTIDEVVGRGRHPARQVRAKGGDKHGRDQG